MSILLPVLTCAALNISALSVALIVRSYMSVCVWCGEGGGVNGWKGKIIIATLLEFFLNEVYLASFSDFPTIRFGITCSIQKWRLSIYQVNGIHVYLGRCKQRGGKGPHLEEHILCMHSLF